MPIALGDPVEADYSDPLGLLSACHLRIQRFLRLLIDVTRQLHGQALSEDQRSAMQTARRYFREAAPNHTLDEDESLFPRLRACANPAARAAIAELDTLHRDHVMASASHSEVDLLVGRWQEAGCLSGDEAHRLAGLLNKLDALYQKHIALEEDHIFPLAGKILSASQLAEVGCEMANRRGVDLEALRSSKD